LGRAELAMRRIEHAPKWPCAEMGLRRFGRAGLSRAVLAAPICPDTIKNEFKMKLKNLPKTRLKERNFAKIVINITKADIILDTYLIWTKIFAPQEKSRLTHSLILSIYKKWFEFLEFPFKSSCSHYNGIKNPFNSLSHNHCIRQCIRSHCEQRLDCSCFPLLSIVNQLDYGFNILDVCSLELIQTFEKQFHNFCDNLCPMDCFSYEIYTTDKPRYYDVSYLKQNKGNITIDMNWDQNRPFLNYKERPQITFNDYFYYIGGLFGMWFGISANQLFTYFINRYSYVSYYFIDIFKFLLSSLRNKLNIIGVKLMRIENNL
jgi:hypothetical protein